MSRYILALMCVMLALTPLSLGGVSRTAERTPQTTVTQSIALPEPQAASTNELRCLADVIYFEARGESKANRMAVGQVAINRTKHDEYPDTICGVVHQGVRRQACQFSWACDRTRRVNEPDAYDDAQKLAELLYNEYMVNQTLPDIVNGATHFHNTTVQPGWASRLERTARIDDHIFYAQRSGRSYQ